MKTFEIKQSSYPYLELKTLLLWITQRKPDWIIAHLNIGFQMHHIFHKKWTLFISAYAGYQSSCRKGHKINYQPSFDPNTLPLLCFPTPENNMKGPNLLLFSAQCCTPWAFQSSFLFWRMSLFLINLKLFIRFPQMPVLSHDLSLAFKVIPLRI